VKFELGKEVSLMVKKNIDASPNYTSETITLLLAEYNALREEILKRMELQHQVMFLALLVFGTILGAGIQFRSPSIILLYPIIAVFLAANWTYNHRRIRELGAYIRVRIEARVGQTHIGWESYLNEISRPRIFSQNFTATSGVFMGTSVFAIVVAIPIAKFDITEILLLIIAILCTIGSLFTLGRAPISKVPDISDKNT
jgi:hypothetical protein